MVPRRFQDALGCGKMAPDASKMLPRCPKMPPRGPKRPPKGLQEVSKIDVSSQLGPPEPQKSFKIYYEYISFGLQSIFCIKSIIYDVLAPVYHQNPTKTPPRCLQEAPRRPKLVPKTAQEPPKRRPRRLKNHPRAAQEASWRRPRTSLEPDDAQEQPQSRPKAAQTPLQTSILDHFGNNLIEMLIHF